MLYKKITFTFLLLLLLGNLYADDISHKQAAAELLEATQAKKTVSAYIRQLEQNLTAMPLRPDLTQQQLAIAKAYQTNIIALMKKSLNWEIMKPDFITLYAKAYNEQDLSELSRFYQSRLGKSMLEKTPLIMQYSMQISQMHMQKIMPEIQKSTQEMMAQIQSLEKK